MLGMLADKTGTRPSAFFEWNDPEDWQDRYWFDISCVMAYQEKKYAGVSGTGRTAKKPRKRRR